MPHLLWACNNPASLALLSLQPQAHPCAQFLHPNKTTPPNFLSLQTPSMQPCERRYILLVLWMARLGAGVIPGKSIVDAARRLRFS